MTVIDWAETILHGGPSEVRWQAILQTVADIAVSDADAGQLERSLDAGDRLLADAAFDLWLEFGGLGGSSVRAMEDWWAKGQSTAGRAVLILDGLSLREIRVIKQAAESRGLSVPDATIVTSPIPADTQAFASALGLRGRAQLKSSGYGASFLFASSKPWTDVTEGFDFSGLAGHIPPVPHVLLWDAWPDRLLHDSADKSSGPSHFASTVEKVLSDDGFWKLVERLRQGRRLVITSDHGYAVSHRFLELPQALGETMRLHFGASRCGSIPSVPIDSPANPPLMIEAGGRAAVIGPWKWKCPGGYPHLNHGGLTLGEVCVPFITFEALS